MFESEVTQELYNSLALAWLGCSNRALCPEPRRVIKLPFAEKQMQCPPRRATLTFLLFAVCSVARIL